MSSFDVCNAAVRVINRYVLEEGVDLDGINDIGARPIDPNNPDAGYRVQVSYGDEEAPCPPRCAPVLSERLAKAGLADVVITYMAASPAELQ